MRFTPYWIWCGKVRPKDDIFSPNLTPLHYRFQNFEPHIFYSSPYAVFRLPGKFGWGPFSSLREIAGERQTPRTGPRVGINSPTFLGHSLADFCAVFTTRYRIYPVRIRRRCFFKNFSHLSAILDLVRADLAKKLHFCLQFSWPPTDCRSLTPRFLFQSICRLRGKFGWDLFNSLEEFAILI